MKSYPAYKHSGVPWLGEIPEHWTLRPLRTLMRRNEVRGFPKLTLLSVVREKGIIVRNTESKEENHNFIPDDLSKYKLVRKGQFVINKMKAWQGSYGISDYEGIVSPAYFVYSMDNSSLLPAFFHTAIRSMAYIPFFSKYSDGVRIGQWDLDEAEMKKITFYCPPLSEQAAIAAYLDKKCGEIDEMVRRRQAIIERLRELKQALIAKAVTKGLHTEVPMKDSGIPWLGEIPEDWKIMRFSRLVAGRAAGAWGDEANNNEGDMICVRVADFDFESFSFKDSDILTTRNYTKETILRLSLHKGDILVEKSGGGKKTPVGRAIIYEKDYPAVYSNFIERITPNNFTISKWFLYVWNALYLTGSLVPFIKQTTGIQNLNLNALLRTVKVTIPSKEEQSAIVAYLDQKCAAIDELISRHGQIVEKLKELKASAIAHVVTGKIDIREGA